MSTLFNIPEDNKSGVYSITNQRNGRKYIGSSLNLKSRAYSHKQLMQKGKHSNKEIQKDIEKGDNFIFNIISITDKTICFKRSEIKHRTRFLEYQKIMSAISSGENLYNMETIDQVRGRLAAEQEELNKIFNRKLEILKILELPNDEVLKIYKHNIYDEEEMKIFEKEILKRMNK